MTDGVLMRYGKKPTKDKCVSFVKTYEGDLKISIDQGFDGGDSMNILLNQSSIIAIKRFLDQQFQEIE